jgi:hypothetical protein
MEAAQEDGLGRLLRYEDMVADPFGQMRGVVDHLGIRVTDAELARIVEANSFKKTTGRDPGTEARGTHNRKGVAGDWTAHFDRELIAAWAERGGERMELIGYPMATGASDAAV